MVHIRGKFLLECFGRDAFSMGAQFEAPSGHDNLVFCDLEVKKGNKTRDQIGTLFGSAPIDPD
jgi:hypothetical protein